MKRIFAVLVVLTTCFLHAESPAYVAGPERILLVGGEGAPHVALPHAAADDEGNVWLVYRSAPSHVGSIGTLNLIRYGPDVAVPRLRKTIYSSPRLDPRDPTIAFVGGMLYVSFFQYNYTFNMVRQFVLKLDGETAEPVGPPEMITNRAVLNHSASSPVLADGDRLLLPVYFVKDFFSAGTDVGYFVFGSRSSEAELTVIAEGSDYGSFFLEPAVAMRGNSWISLFRSSPVSSGPGGLAPMYMSRSPDGGKTWDAPVKTPFYGHHPRMTVDSEGRIWAGFRDLSAYGTANYKAKITLWRPDPDDGETASAAERTVTVYETDTPDPGNWDCGYPSLIPSRRDGFRVIYYYARNGRFHIAVRTLNPAR